MGLALSVLAFEHSPNTLMMYGSNGWGLVSPGAMSGDESNSSGRRLAEIM